MKNNSNEYSTNQRVKWIDDRKKQHIFVVSNYYDEFEFEFDSIERASRNKFNEK